MKKPTRFERMVEQEYLKWLHGSQEAGWLSIPNILLTREHRAVLRKLKRLEWLNPSTEFQRGQTYAVKELLAWLKARAR